MRFEALVSHVVGNVNMTSLKFDTTLPHIRKLNDGSIMSGEKLILILGPHSYH